LPLNTHPRLFTVFGLGLSATLSLWFVPARAASGDASAISRFLSIAYANADTNFVSIRDPKAGAMKTGRSMRH